MSPDELHDLAAVGRAAWPDLQLDEAAFTRQLQLRLETVSDRQAALSKLRPDDLYLACACAEGNQAAIVAFEKRFAKVIDRAVGRFARTSDRRDELKQLLRERLFVAPPGGQPRIASYTGQGFLENWLRVAAVRAFVNADRGKKPAGSSDEETLSVLADGHDLELGFLKGHYRSAFRSAFARAIEALPPSDRLVLKLTVLQRLSCDEVAKSLGIHRATAARRSARARQQLVDGTRQELARTLRIDDVELASLLQLVESNLDLSISRLLDPSGEPATGTDPTPPLGPLFGRGVSPK